MTSQEAPPKSFDREGGVERVKLARYARWFGIFLITLSVLAWVTLSKRPGVPDRLVAEAVEWAESAPRVPCERPVLFGEATQGTGSLRPLVERGGRCTDARCSILVDAVQHERVCAPERHRSDDWVESVIETADALDDPSEQLRLIMSALRALDDFRRGEQRGFPMPNDGSLLHASLQRILDREPTARLDELVAAAETLVETSPDATFFIGRNAGEVLWVLQRGQQRVTRRYPHPRALTVALARLGQELDTHCTYPTESCTGDWNRCSRFMCVSTYFNSLTRPEEIPKWRTLLQGPRANGEAWILGNMQFVGQQLDRHIFTFEKQRAVERVLLAALQIRAELGCPNSVQQAAQVLGETLVSEDEHHAVVPTRAPFEITLEAVGDVLHIRDALPDALALRTRLCTESAEGPL